MLHPTRICLYKIFGCILAVLAFARLAEAQVSFIENKGQWETSIKYRAEVPGGWLFIENGKLSYILAENEPFEIMHRTHFYDKPVKMHYYRVNFEGSNPNPVYKTEQLSVTYYNFFLGNDPKKWTSGVQAYHKITVKELYKNIDLEIYGSSNNSIKYNLIIKPGANPDDIKMRYEGLDDMHLSGGKLHLHTSVGEITEQIPVCYQFQDTAVKYVKTDYDLKGNLLTFDVKERYNRRKNFIIDPQVVFSTYSGSRGDNWGFTGTWDNAGNGYGGGTVYRYDGSNGSFPATPGAFQTFFQGGVNGNGEDLARDAAIYKVTSDGSTLLYATYIGGAHNEEPHSMVVNSKNELVILGSTFSDNFPTTGAAFDRFFNGAADIFIFTLSEDGTTMVASTYIGGTGRDGLNGEELPGSGNISPLAYNYGDMARGEVMVDKADNVYIAACTQSSVGFPLVNAFQNTFGGEYDGVVMKLNPDLSQILWGSYVGGPGFDACNGLDIDASGNLFVAGGTTAGINGITPGLGAFTTFSGGSSDGFLIKIPPAGNTMQNATYLGTNAYDQAYFVKVDKFDNPYVTGQTAGDWPITAPIYNNPRGGQFISKFTNDLKTMTRSMTYGDGDVKPQISPSAFMVDECERIFVSGWGGEVNDAPLGHGGGTEKMPKTDDAWQKTTDGSDFHLAVFSKNLDELTYATFLGGWTQKGRNGGEHVDGGTSRFDRKGIVYQSVCAGCNRTDRFPTTPGAHSQTNNSNNCNNAVFKLDFQNLNRAPIVTDTFFSVMANNTLSFVYSGKDLDPYDTLFLETQSPQLNASFPDPKPKITIADKGFKQLDINFNWTPGCQHATGDTLYIKTYIRDVGCPESKNDSAVIKILVLEPPVLPPPDVLCLVPQTVNSVKLRWEGVDTTNPYFSHFILKKTDPQGKEYTIGPFKKGDSLEYIDKAVSNYRDQNYCYYLYTVNICDKPGASTYTLCTKDQFNAPIKTTEIVSATVVENKNVKISWLNTKEDDFDAYLIYRAPKTTSNDINNYKFYQGFTNPQDTFFIDDDVKVNLESYCYRVQVTDKCGHISLHSNKGCNIVLKGISEPYLHKLSWDNYNDWKVGVDNYELVRRDDRQAFSQIYQGAPSVLNFADDKFDYDWGGYWYKVIATESGGNNATSESNEVYLIQKPLLHVPTSFTPNDDNRNEVWGTVDVFVKDYHMQVFNRWGQKVFESFDKNEQWNGSFAGTGPADNVFVWMVRYTGWDKSIHIQKGTVTILN